MNVGDVARVRARFQVDGALVVPGALSMVVTPAGDDGKPDPALAWTADYPGPYITRVDTAQGPVFYGYVAVERRGRWRVEMRATGNGAGAGFVTFFAYD